MNKKGKNIKDLASSQKLNSLLGVTPEEEITEEEATFKAIQEAFKQVDSNSNKEEITAFINELKDILGTLKGGMVLNPSTEEKNATEGRNSRTNEKEKKERRANLLFRPSSYDDFGKLATIRNTSINDLMNTIVENTVNDNADILEAYDKLNQQIK